MYSGITGGRVFLYTKILEVNLFAFAYTERERERERETNID